MSDSEYPPVKFIRLKTGDDIVSEIVEVGEDDILNYHLINPFKVVYYPTGESGYIQIAFMPWVFSRICDKQEFTINSEDVLLINDVTEHMTKYYWETLEGPPEQEDNKIEESDLESLEEVLEQLSLSKRTFH